jgi:hypothetical protein
MNESVNHGDRVTDDIDISARCVCCGLTSRQPSKQFRSDAGDDRIIGTGSEIVDLVGRRGEPHRVFNVEP